MTTRARELKPDMVAPPKRCVFRNHLAGVFYFKLINQPMKGAGFRAEINRDVLPEWNRSVYGDDDVPGDRHGYPRERPY